MKQIKINIDDKLYEEIKKDFTDSEIIGRANWLVNDDIKDTIRIIKKNKEEDEKITIIKILEQNNEIYDGFWFGTDEEKARKKMENFKKYKKKYKEKYKDKKIQLIVKNKLEEEIIVNNL